MARSTTERHRSEAWSIRAVLAAAALLSLAFPLQAWSMPRGRLVLVGATVFDSASGRMRPNLSVRLADGRIVQIGSDLAPQPGEQVIDARGKYLLPGFVDANVHATAYGTPARRDTTVKYADANETLGLEFVQRQLKYGVTTVRDSYGLLVPERAVRDRIAAGEVPGPRLLVAGNILGWGGPFSLTFSLTPESELSPFQERWNDFVAQETGESLLDLTPDELRVAVRRYLEKGVDFVKYGGTSHFRTPALIAFSPAAQKVIVEEAHSRGLLVDTHATSAEGLRIAVEAGVDVVQHPEMLSRDYPEPLLRLLVERRVFCAVRANLLSGEAWRRISAEHDRAEDQERDAAPPSTGAEMRRREAARREPDLIQRRNAERLIRAGCRVVIGTDNYLGDAPEFRRTPKGPEQEPGSGTLLAIEGLVELGMSPAAALTAATRTGAAAAGLRDGGEIAVGKLADLVLLDADPLQDIRAVRRIALVVVDGRVVDRDALPHTHLFVGPPPATTETSSRQIKDAGGS